jgi:hypothetical protein
MADLPSEKSGGMVDDEPLLSSATATDVDRQANKMEATKAGEADEMPLSSVPKESDDAVRESDEVASADSRTDEYDGPAASEKEAAVDDVVNESDDDLCIANGVASAADLGTLYDRWAEGSLPPATVRALAKAPREPSSSLRWWQWVERTRGDDEHTPPRPVPRFVVASGRGGGGTKQQRCGKGSGASEMNSVPSSPALSCGGPSLAVMYDRWAAGALDAETLAALERAPVEPSSQLRWWQWVERHRGFELHEPHPRSRPRFLSVVCARTPLDRVVRLLLSGFLTM